MEILPDEAIEQNWSGLRLLRLASCPSAGPPQDHETNIASSSHWPIIPPQLAQAASANRSADSRNDLPSHPTGRSSLAPIVLVKMLHETAGAACHHRPSGPTAAKKFAEHVSAACPADPSDLSAYNRGVLFEIRGSSCVLRLSPYASIRVLRRTPLLPRHRVMGSNIYSTPYLLGLLLSRSFFLSLEGGHCRSWIPNPRSPLAGTSYTLGIWDLSLRSLIVHLDWISPFKVIGPFDHDPFGSTVANEQVLSPGGFIRFHKSSTCRAMCSKRSPANMVPMRRQRLETRHPVSRWLHLYQER